MLIVSIYINAKQIDEVGVVNTGHKNKDTGLYLYRISHPPEYKKKFNKYEIWHNRKDPWPVLVRKVMEVLEKESGFFIYKKEKEKDLLEKHYIKNLIKLSNITHCS